MGFRGKVALALVTVILHQIISTHCMPSKSRKSSLKRYLDNLEYSETYNSPKSPSAGAKPSKSIFSTGKNADISKYSYTPPKKSTQKLYNFPEMECLDASPKDPFNMGTNLNTFRQPENTVVNPQSKLIEDLKKDMKMKRKLNRNINIEPPKQSLTEPSPGPDSMWVHNSGTFPEVEYPLNAMETWMPHYWNPSFPQKEPRYDGMVIPSYDTKVSDKNKETFKPYKRPLQSKAKHFKEQMDMFKKKKSKPHAKPEFEAKKTNIKDSNSGVKTDDLKKLDSNLSNDAAVETVLNKLIQEVYSSFDEKDHIRNIHDRSDLSKKNLQQAASEFEHKTLSETTALNTNKVTRGTDSGSAQEFNNTNCEDTTKLIEQANSNSAISDNTGPIHVNQQESNNNGNQGQTDPSVIISNSSNTYETEGNTSDVLEPLNVKIPLPVAQANPPPVKESADKVKQLSVIVVPVNNALNTIQLPFIETNTDSPIIVVIPTTQTSATSPQTSTGNLLPSLSFIGNNSDVSKINDTNNPVVQDSVKSNHIYVNTENHLTELPKIESKLPNFEELRNNSIRDIATGLSQAILKTSSNKNRQNTAAMLPSNPTRDPSKSSNNSKIPLFIPHYNSLDISQTDLPVAQHSPISNNPPLLVTDFLHNPLNSPNGRILPSNQMNENLLLLNNMPKSNYEINSEAENERYAYQTLQPDFSPYNIRSSQYPSRSETVAKTPLSFQNDNTLDISKPDLPLSPSISNIPLSLIPRPLQDPSNIPMDLFLPVEHEHFLQSQTDLKGHSKITLSEIKTEDYVNQISHPNSSPYYINPSKSVKNTNIPLSVVSDHITPDISQPEVPISLAPPISSSSSQLVTHPLTSATSVPKQVPLSVHQIKTDPRPSNMKSKDQDESNIKSKSINRLSNDNIDISRSLSHVSAITSVPTSLITHPLPSSTNVLKNVSSPVDQNKIKLNPSNMKLKNNGGINEKRKNNSSVPLNEMLKKNMVPPIDLIKNIVRSPENSIRDKPTSNTIKEAEGLTNNKLLNRQPPKNATVLPVSKKLLSGTNTKKESASIVNKMLQENQVADVIKRVIVVPDNRHNKLDGKNLNSNSGSSDHVKGVLSLESKNSANTQYNNDDNALPDIQSGNNTHKGIAQSVSASVSDSPLIDKAVAHISEDNSSSEEDFLMMDTPISHIMEVKPNSVTLNIPVSDDTNDGPLDFISDDIFDDNLSTAVSKDMPLDDFPSEDNLIYLTEHMHTLPEAMELRDPSSSDIINDDSLSRTTEVMLENPFIQSNDLDKHVIPEKVLADDQSIEQMEDHSLTTMVDTQVTVLHSDYNNSEEALLEDREIDDQLLLNGAPLTTRAFDINSSLEKIFDEVFTNSQFSDSEIDEQMLQERVDTNEDNTSLPVEDTYPENLLSDEVNDENLKAILNTQSAEYNEGSVLEEKLLPNSSAIDIIDNEDAPLTTVYEDIPDFDIKHDGKDTNTIETDVQSDEIVPLDTESSNITETDSNKESELNEQSSEISNTDYEIPVRENDKADSVQTDISEEKTPVVDKDLEDVLDDDKVLVIMDKGAVEKLEDHGVIHTALADANEYGLPLPNNKDPNSEELLDMLKYLYVAV